MYAQHYILANIALNPASSAAAAAPGLGPVRRLLRTLEALEPELGMTPPELPAARFRAGQERLTTWATLADSESWPRKRLHATHL